MERLVDNICTLYGYENEGFLGSGDFGETYQLSDNKVLKITSDDNEVLCCFKLLDKENENLVNITNLIHLKNNQFVIIMDYLSTRNIEDIYSMATNLIEEHSEHLETIDIEDYTDNEDIINFVNDIQTAIYELRKNGVDSYDIHSGNIGFNKNTNKYILFDQRMLNATENDLNEVKDVLVKRLNIEGNVLKNISLENVLFIEENFEKEVKSLNSGNFYKQEIKAYISENSEIVIVSGYSEIIKTAISTCDDIILDIKVVHDERKGLNYQNKGKTFYPNTDDVFIGIEDYLSENELNNLIISLEEYNNKNIKKTVSALNKNNETKNKKSFC